MKLLSHHKWIAQAGFRTWQCPKCGALRYWETVLQRMVFQKYGQMRYGTPECASIINCDKVVKEAINYNK